MRAFQYFNSLDHVGCHLACGRIHSVGTGCSCRLTTVENHIDLVIFESTQYRIKTITATLPDAGNSGYLIQKGASIMGQLIQVVQVKGFHLPGLGMKSYNGNRKEVNGVGKTGLTGSNWLLSFCCAEAENIQCGKKEDEVPFHCEGC